MLFLPWAMNMVILYYSNREATGFSHCVWWVALLALSLPLLLWHEPQYNSVAAMNQLVHLTYTQWSAVVLRVLGYVMPFAVYPLIVFWCKQLTVYKEPDEKSSDGERQRTQAQLVTYAIKTLVIIFGFFDMLSVLGVRTDNLLQIGAVFSMGLSWSMRDWLCSMWAGFMVAFTTRLGVGSFVCVGFSQATTPPRWMRVVRTGLIFTICVPVETPSGDSATCMYLPNSVLISSGFTLK